MSTTNNNDESNTSRMIGQVKWFNNKAGYGFITVSDGEYSGKDIFAHYSTINVIDSQYKYLVQGEYVEFDLSVSTNTSHEYQATKISGIKGGMLMCETRQMNRAPRNERNERTDREQVQVQVASAGTSEPNTNYTNKEYRPDSQSKRKPAFKRRMVEKPLSPIDMDGFKVVTKKRSSAK